MADLTALEALRRLVGAVPFYQQHELDFEHYRWSLYERALHTEGAETTLLAALREEPDAVVARAALWELVERPQWVQEALSVLPDEVDHPVRVHAHEARLLQAVVDGQLGSDVDCSTWSNWLQRQVCAKADDPEVLHALAERGFSRHVRAQAAQRLRALSKSRPGRPTAR